MEFLDKLFDRIEKIPEEKSKKWAIPVMILTTLIGFLFLTLVVFLLLDSEKASRVTIGMGIFYALLTLVSIYQVLSNQ